MASTVRRSIFVVAGVGNGSGTGASTARVFANAGYNVALIARNADHLKKTADDITSGGGNAAAFPVKAYTHTDIHEAFEAIKRHWNHADIRVGLYNAGAGVWKNFLDITPEELQLSIDTHIIGAAAFARESILAFKDLPVDESGKRGALLFTGATASLRGNKTTSAFAAGKFGLRALAQSLSKEFGRQDIHVVHSVVDGQIATDLQKSRHGAEWAENEAVRLNPESIGNAYLYLAKQDRSAWTWELDLRPAHENW